MLRSGNAPSVGVFVKGRWEDEIKVQVSWGLRKEKPEKPENLTAF